MIRLNESQCGVSISTIWDGRPKGELACVLCYDGRSINPQKNNAFIAQIEDSGPPRMLSDPHGKIKAAHFGRTCCLRISDEIKIEIDPCMGGKL